MYLEIDRTNFRTRRFVEFHAPTSPPPGHVVMKLDRFALTSNNISYALGGDFLDYWGFFPTEAGWGRLPVMGYGVVTASGNPDIAVGGRYFGFFPVGSHHVVHGELTRAGFTDIGPHREKHAMVYRNFDRVSDAVNDEESDADNAHLIFRGLFITSFLAEDFLRAENFYGATQVIVTSASSKTSLALAHSLRVSGGVRVVGLTSRANASFVAGTELYDEIVTYDDIRSLEASASSIVVDMAGNKSVVAQIHEHFGSALAYSMSIGATHWEQTQSSTPITGTQPQFFFAPSQIAKRAKEWGRDELNGRIDSALQLFIADTDRWLTISHTNGTQAVDDVYQGLIDGTVQPNMGHILSL
jgi:hypothetical protein